VKRVLIRLDSAHRELLDAVEPLDESILASRPSESEWSIAEIINHLRLVEERVINELGKALEKPPAQLGLVRRLVPTSIVASRLIRVKAPKAVVPLSPPDKVTNIAEFNRVREELKQLCRFHGKEKLNRITFKHPFLGKLTGVAAVSFVAYHERRHYKQIREVLKKIH
jgi:hypothetical protein